MSAVAIEFTEEQLNYYRICYVVTDIITDGLRSIFKQEWDNRYRATFGEWKDEPRNGMDFKNSESLGNQRRNAKLLSTMINGDRAEWDCAMLFYAILFSDCIGLGLNSVVKSNVDDIRQFRNEEFPHMSKGYLSDPDFQTAIGKVHAAFQGLGLSTFQIQDIKNQRSFPTEELRSVLGKVKNLRQEIQEKDKKLQEKGKELQEKGNDLQKKAKELQEKERRVLEKEEERQVVEDQLQNEISTFCILPPKPSHDVASRDFEVAEIMQQLKRLKRTNENKLNFLYISGNPGSGKSQLAGLVAERFFDEVKEIPCATSFVMTLNAESQHTLLESYVSFARRLKCPEYAITETLNSKDLTIETKITSLKTLIGTKIELYTSWLLLVDNVTSISLVHAHLPESGNEQWIRGQLLITTQDSASIPLTNSFIKHISVIRGMKPRDANALLAELSGVDDSEKGEEVAQALDYQPLALASAATYVRQVRQNEATSHFGWNDYLEKLNKGHRVSTETILAKTNPSYSNSISKATRLAAEKAMTSDKVIYHTFSLLSVCATTPLSLDIVIRYILNADEEIKDKEMIAMTIQRCSLLLFGAEEKGSAYIRVHQIVSDVIESLIRDFPETHQRQTVDAAVVSFIQVVEDDLSIKWFDLDSFKYSNHLVPHLKILITKSENLFHERDISQYPKGSIRNVQNYRCSFTKLGKMCLVHGVFDAAKKYFGLALQFAQRSDEHNHDKNVAEGYSNLAEVQRRLGDLEQAKGSHERALGIYLNKLGPDHLDVATCYRNLGLVHHALGNLEQAKEYHDRALAIRVKKLGPDHLDVATCYNTLGVEHHHLGNLDQAKENYDRALGIYLNKLGPDHLDVATCYRNLGLVQHALRNLEQAKEYHYRALAIRLKKLGPDHLDVGTCYDNLGSVHRALGNLEQAKGYHDRALAIRLKRLDPDHLDVGTCYGNLGLVHCALGNLEQSKEYHYCALAIRLNKLGPDHLDVAECYNALGLIHGTLRNLEQAKENHDRALAIRLKKLGPDHLDVATCYNNLGLVQHLLGNLEQSKEYLNCALAIRLNKLGPDHLDVATCYYSLGLVHCALGDLELAKECQENALTIRLKKLGHDHLNVAKCYRLLGLVHCDLGNLEQAKECLEHALAIRLKKLGPDHRDVSTVQQELTQLQHTMDSNSRKRHVHHTSNERCTIL